MDCSTPGFPVLHHLPELAQTHVHCVDDAIQPSHPLSPLLFLSSIFPSIRVFFSESALHITSSFSSFIFISPTFIKATIILPTSKRSILELFLLLLNGTLIITVHFSIHSLEFKGDHLTVFSKTPQLLFTGLKMWTNIFNITSSACHGFSQHDSLSSFSHFSAQLLPPRSIPCFKRALSPWVTETFTCSSFLAT